MLVNDGVVMGGGFIIHAPTPKDEFQPAWGQVTTKREAMNNSLGRLLSCGATGFMMPIWLLSLQKVNNYEKHAKSSTDIEKEWVLELAQMKSWLVGLEFMHTKH